MRFTVQVIAILLTLMFGIVLGIGSAETNMQKIQGNPGATQAVQITPDEEGKIEIAVLGKVYETPNPLPASEEERTEKKEPPPPSLTNVGSSRLGAAGNSAGEGIRQVAQSIVDGVSNWVRERMRGKNP